MKRVIAATAALTLGLVAIVSAKGATVRVVVTGGALHEPIDIADPGALRPFGVWAGPGVTISGQPQRDGFIVNWWHGAVTEPSSHLPRHEVQFYAARGDESPALAYVVTYVYDPPTDRGYVYLPGRGEPHAAMNMRNMYRGGMEGQWFLSTGAWDDLIMPLLLARLGRDDSFRD